MKPSVRRTFLVAVLVAACPACTASQEQLRSTVVERAAFDLDCPKEQIAATQLGDTVVIGRTTQTPGLERAVLGATGCGKKGVYIVECVSGVGGSACNAQMNADAQPAPPRATP